MRIYTINDRVLLWRRSTFTSKRLTDSLWNKWLTASDSSFSFSGTYFFHWLCLWCFILVILKIIHFKCNSKQFNCQNDNLIELHYLFIDRLCSAVFSISAARPGFPLVAANAGWLADCMEKNINVGCHKIILALMLCILLCTCRELQ